MEQIIIKTENKTESEMVLNHAFGVLNCYWPNDSKEIEKEDLEHKIYGINEEGCIFIIDPEIEEKYPSGNIVPFEFFIKIKKIEW